MSDLLESTLRELARDLHTPAPEELASRVLARVAAEPVPRPSRGAALAAWVRERRRWVAALVAGLLVGGVVASPVGATVREWFDFHGLVVSEETPQGTGSPVVPSVPGQMSLQEAEALAGFTPVLPEALGTPDGVGVSADRRIVSLSWGSGDDAIRLDQFDGSIDPVFWKAAPDSERVDVNGGDGLWFPTPHDVLVVPADGGTQTLAPRLGAQTLVWPRGRLTLRLEGAFTKAEAQAIAASTS